jgi:seryl-tRNA synthetase
MIYSNHHFLIQHYPSVTGLVPEVGVMVLLIKTPAYGSAIIQVFGDGTATIAELYTSYLATHTGSGDMQTQINAEARTRKEADDMLAQNIANETNARKQALEKEAQTRDAKIAAEEKARKEADDTLTQAVSALEEALEKDISDKVNELIEAIKLKANIESPHFTGVPETPTPDYYNPLQVLNVYSYEELKDIITIFAKYDYMVYSNKKDIMIYSNRQDVMSIS